jgi:hypothetical protein
MAALRARRWRGGEEPATTSAETTKEEKDMEEKMTTLVLLCVLALLLVVQSLILKRTVEKLVILALALETNLQRNCNTLGESAAAKKPRDWIGGSKVKHLTHFFGLLRATPRATSYSCSPISLMIDRQGGQTVMDLICQAVPCCGSTATEKWIGNGPELSRAPPVAVMVGEKTEWTLLLRKNWRVVAHAVNRNQKI